MTDPAPLDRNQKIRLLRIARESVFKFVSRGQKPKIEEDDPRLATQQGVFVSLHSVDRDRLRGCIGTFESDDPLYITVMEMAIGAATHDTRFPRMRMDELPKTEFELSILGPLTPARPEDVEVGKHGLLVAKGRTRGTLLPQVATQYDWDREEFLSQTCIKAGLERDDWKSDEARIWTFTAEVFCETDMRPTR